MSYFGMSKRMYADRKAWDGVIESGWRRVRKGGRVKIAAIWWHAPELESVPAGELVHVRIGDYWMESVHISRGAIGCNEWLCEAFPEKKNANK